MTRLGDQDLYLFNEGTHVRLYEKLGAHPGTREGTPGTYFAVWAPNARRVSVVGQFNYWSAGANPLTPRGSSGIWEGFVPRVGPGELYKYHIESHFDGYVVEKADPFGFRHETPPRTASVVWELDYEWYDQEWMSSRKRRNSLGAPLSIYEVHLGSWRRVPEEGNRPFNYRELAPLLAEHVTAHGFTHVELLPITEHPFYGSWGYQVTGYFAPTSRYGSPQDLMFLIDYLHREGIGVILDWVPAHFPSDQHGLGYFDGTHLYEHADPRRGFHPDWKSCIFNYGRHEVKSFLISSALFWLDRYHVDGLRVDGVASMLYLDYSREEGEWVPNEHGSRENLEAIGFLRQLNEAVYEHFPGVQTIAEESTAWPMVSRPTYLGGLGFGMKWDMGWMHDTLKYFERDSIHRKFHHGELTFRGVYAYHENFVLPLSHDEVVHGKGSLISKMPGDDWQKFANLRTLYAYMFATPGQKLLFQGSEIAQRAEWHHDESVDWHLLEYEPHRGIAALITELNRLYREHPALHLFDAEPRGFAWLEGGDAENSVLVFERIGDHANDRVVAAFNLTPVPRDEYRVGVDIDGSWEKILDTDAPELGGSGYSSQGAADAEPIPWHGRKLSIRLTLPPLAAVWWRPTHS